MSNLSGRGPLGLKGERGLKRPASAAAKTKIRDAARGQNCCLRLACCNGKPETVVLAHIRKFGWAGMGQKPHDILSVFACHSCHDAMDGRSKVECTDADILRGHGETLMILVQSGIITGE